MIILRGIVGLPFMLSARVIGHSRSKLCFTDTTQFAMVETYHSSLYSQRRHEYATRKLLYMELELNSICTNAHASPSQLQQLTAWSGLWPPNDANSHNIH